MTVLSMDGEGFRPLFKIGKVRMTLDRLLLASNDVTWIARIFSRREGERLSERSDWGFPEHFFQVSLPTLGPCSRLFPMRIVMKRSKRRGLNGV
jgi:hypothetical protein